MKIYVPFSHFSRGYFYLGCQDREGNYCFIRVHTKMYPNYQKAAFTFKIFSENSFLNAASSMTQEISLSCSIFSHLSKEIMNISLDQAISIRVQV